MAKTLVKEAKRSKGTSVSKAPAAVLKPLEPATPPEVAEGPVCAHHWVIASPNGETSVGKCKVCGTEKEFPNSADDYLWERSVPQSRWTGRTEAKSFADGY